MVEQSGELQRSRLSDADPAKLLWPLRRAEKLTKCFLYWIPVRSFPIPLEQRAWLNAFIDRFSQLLEKEQGLRSECFLQLKTVYPALLETFIDKAHDLVPVMGFSHRPGVELPPIPTLKELQPILDGKEKYKFEDSIGDYCYWFLDKDQKTQRQLFWGNGGMSLLFMNPDPNTKVAPLPIPKGIRNHPTFMDLFKKNDPDKAFARANALKDSFRAKSLELFGQIIGGNLQLKGVPFIIPLLSTGDFFQRPNTECSTWFELFEVYLNESPKDQGILIASKLDLEDALINLLKQMTRDGLRYSLG